MTAASNSEGRKRAAESGQIMHWGPGGGEPFTLTPNKVLTLEADPVEVVARAGREHRVECTGFGEVTCAGCRSLGWMSWHTYHNHIAEASIAALRENGFTL
jgi:hypothetical protein